MVRDHLPDLWPWPFGAIALIGLPILLAGTVGSPQDLLGDWTLSIPETENHRLNIETSKFLTNADSIARLKVNNYGTGHLEDEQKEVRDWLMRRLQDIAQNDFQEYNARPYSRYSLNAILNLSDFAGGAGDKDLALAASIVLDLSAAKFAATSNRGRRIVPFRRRSNEDGDEKRYLYESSSGADHEIPGRCCSPVRLNSSTRSTHSALTENQIRWRHMDTSWRSWQRWLTRRRVITVFHLAPSRKLSEGQAFEQTIRHTSVERVEQSPAFTISAGGIATGPTAKFLCLALPQISATPCLR